MPSKNSASTQSVTGSPPMPDGAGTADTSSLRSMHPTHLGRQQDFSRASALLQPTVFIQQHLLRMTGLFIQLLTLRITRQSPCCWMSAGQRPMCRSALAREKQWQHPIRHWLAANARWSRYSRHIFATQHAADTSSAAARFFAGKRAPTADRFHSAAPPADDRVVHSAAHPANYRAIPMRLDECGLTADV